MPHMNELIEMIAEASDHLKYYLEIMLANNGRVMVDVDELVKRMEIALDEFEALKVGHLARS